MEITQRNIYQSNNCCILLQIIIYTFLQCYFILNSNHFDYVEFFFTQCVNAKKLLTFKYKKLSLALKQKL